MGKANPARTVGVTIDCSRNEAYAFAVEPRNLPKWARSFVQSVKEEGGKWVMQTTRGPATIRFAERNTLGVLDHHVSPGPGMEIYVPMRVVENGQGCEVTLTLFQQEGMTREMFEEDAGMVERDLRSLKEVLERKG